MKQAIIKVISSWLKSYLIGRRRNDVQRHGLNTDAPAEKLTNIELKEINQYWGRILPVTRKKNCGCRFYELLKTYGAFSAQCISEDIFNSYVVRSLNMPVNVVGYEHKSMYGIIFKDINQPHTIINCIRGNLFDSNNSLITIQDARYVLKNHGAEVFVKKSTFSNQGKSVKFFSDSNDCDIDGILSEFGEDFIIQAPVRQSKITSRFSNLSLNTFRISTLFINGRCSLCTILFRCGVGENMVDNGAQGNIMVGVHEDGSFEEFGFDKWLNKYDQSSTGQKFVSNSIPQVKKLIRFAIDNHIKHLPLAGFVGWDLAFDEQDEPVLIEVNLFTPGVYMEQLATHQSLFGDRTNEVIKYVLNHRPSNLSLYTNLGY